MSKHSENSMQLPSSLNHLGNDARRCRKYVDGVEWEVWGQAPRDAVGTELFLFQSGFELTISRILKWDKENTFRMHACVKAVFYECITQKSYSGTHQFGGAR